MALGSAQRDLRARMTDVVLREIDQGVALLTLNRPDRLNAWTNEMHRAVLRSARRLRRARRRAGDRRDRRGEGASAPARTWATSRRSAAATSTTRRTGPTRGRTSTRGRSRSRSSRRSTGACAGLGLVHALMCDLRFAAADAKFTTAFARRGLVAEHGISWLLPRLVGPSRALDLLHVGARRARRGGRRAWASSNRVVRARAGASTRRSAYAARPRGELLADEHGGDEAPDLGGARAVRRRRARRRELAHARVLRPPGLRRGRAELRRAPPAAVRAVRRLTPQRPAVIPSRRGSSATARVTGSVAAAALLGGLARA